MQQEKLLMNNLKKYLLVIAGVVLLASCTARNNRKQTVVANEFLHYYLTVLNKDKAPMILDSYSQKDAARWLLCHFSTHCKRKL